MASMKRREMIKLVALRLFNEVGESNLAAIDIANELDISPGNLYYHFKGKEELINELLNDFTTQLVELVNLQMDSDESLIESWLQLYVMLELLYDYRFFFRNINDIEVRYGDAGARLMRLVGRLHGAVENGIRRLCEADVIDLPAKSTLVESLAHSLVLILLYWESYRMISTPVEGKLAFVQGSSLQILALLSPYLDREQIGRLNLCHQAYLENQRAE